MIGVSAARGLLAAGCLALAVPVSAQTPARYGPPISLAQAQTVGRAAMAEAQRQGVAVAVAVVEPGGSLVWFERADDTQYGSIELAQRKAATAALYRRPTREYYDAVSKGALGLTTLGVVASPGGVPILAEGRVIGAIGVSGGAGLQDAQIADAGAAVRP